MDEDEDVGVLQYERGFRVGTFDRCNGRPCLYGVDLEAKRAAYGATWVDGYKDGYAANEQKIGPAVRTPLEQLMLEMAAADLCDGEITIMGNGHYPHAVRNTLQWCQEYGFLTLPPEPSREEALAYGVEAWGLDPEDYQER